MSGLDKFGDSSYQHKPYIDNPNLGGNRKLSSAGGDSDPYTQIISNLELEQSSLGSGSSAYQLYAAMIADFKAGEAGNYPIQYLQTYMTLASEGEISGTVGTTLHAEYLALQQSGGDPLSIFNTNCGVNNITPITSVTDLISVLTDISQAGTLSDNAELLKMAQDLQSLSSGTVAQAMANGTIQADLQALSSNVEAAVCQMTGIPVPSSSGYDQIIANLEAEQGHLTPGTPAYQLYATMIADFKAGQVGNYPIQYLQTYMTLASQGEISGTVGLTLYSEYQALQASGGTALSTFNTNCGVNNITPITSVTDLISVLTDISQAGTVSDNAGLLKMAQDLQALSSETVSQAMANSCIQADLQALSKPVATAVCQLGGIPVPPSGPGQPTGYFDIGAWNTWNFVDWSTPPHINLTMLDTYLSTYITQARVCGEKQVTFAFAQVKNLDPIINGTLDPNNQSESGDSLWDLVTNTSSLLIEGKSVFQYITKTIRNAGFKVGLSFGGVAATDSDWAFPFSNSTQAAALATELGKWANNTGLTSIDFDIEDPTFYNGQSKALFENPDAIATFFSTLHSQITTSLTVDASYGSWGPEGSVFGSIFSQDSEGITDLFDSLNLMCFNGGYYLTTDPNSTSGWDIPGWVTQLQQTSVPPMTPAEALAFLHIGFGSSVDYTDPNSAAGYPPTPPVPTNLTSGQGAAYLYLQIESQLQTLYKDPSLTLSEPFFWDDGAEQSGSTAYDVDGNGTSHYFDNNPFEADFFNYLNSVKKP